MKHLYDTIPLVEFNPNHDPNTGEFTHAGSGMSAKAFAALSLDELKSSPEASLRSSKYPDEKPLSSDELKGLQARIRLRQEQIDRSTQYYTDDYNFRKPANISLDDYLKQQIGSSLDDDRRDLERLSTPQGRVDEIIDTRRVYREAGDKRRQETRAELDRLAKANPKFGRIMKDLSGWQDDVDVETKRRIERYIIEDTCYGMNRKLRAGKKLSADEHEIADTLDKTLSEHTTKYPMELHRVVGGKALSELTVGTEFVDKGFVSTSLSRNAVENYATSQTLSRKAKRWLTISAPAGTHGAYISPIVVREEEQEFLLPRGTKFRVKRVVGSEIELEIVQ